MSLGLHERQLRARRRTWWFLLIGLITAGVAFLLITFAFQTGRELSKIDIAKLETRIGDQQAEIRKLQGEKQQLVNAAKAAADQELEWQRKYEIGVPNGVSKTLFDQMQAQLQKGIAPERMALFIAQSSKPRSCDPEPESIQLYVRTGIGKPGGKFETTFGGHRLTVTLGGEPAVNEEGQKEAWFDTTKPITVTFTDPVGESSEITGILPLNHQMVVGDSEFQVALAIPEKRRGYVDVTSARCNFP